MNKVEIGDLEFIDEREQIWMTGSWNEYLCLERLSTTKYQLSIRGYEVLGEVSDYTDEDGKLTLPTEWE